MLRDALGRRVRLYKNSVKWPGVNPTLCPS